MPPENELKPFYGKWQWPLARMQPGDWFVVDHARRDPEAVRSYVTMQGSRIGKYFSVAASDPENPGFCRVTCTRPPSLREEPSASTLDYEKVAVKMVDWYGVDLDAVLPWSILPARGKAFVRAARLQAPPVERMIVRIDIQDGWIGLVFKPDGFEVHGLAIGTSPDAWKPEPSIDEVMQ